MGVRCKPAFSRRERLRHELEEILPRLVDDATEQIVLFGSAARGDVGSTSDLDVLVVRHDDRPPAARVDDLYRRARPRVALDLLVYTPEELAEARRTSSFLAHALRDAEILYDRSRALDRASEA